MPYCAFKHCKNSSQKPRRKDGLSFHKFPISPADRNKWISLVRKNRMESDWTPSKFCILCSVHFKDEDFYYTDKDRRMVRKTAVPSQKLTPEISGVATEGMTPLLQAESTPRTRNKVSTSGL